MSSSSNVLFGDLTQTRQSAQTVTKYRLTILWFTLFAISSRLSHVAADARDDLHHTLSQDDIYSYHFNDHSSSDSNSISNSMFGPDGSENDPFSNEQFSLDMTEGWPKIGSIGSSVHKPKCVDIPSTMELCHDIGYKRMMLPNILGHDTLEEVTAQAISWVPLIKIACHPDAKVFLCSLFSPVCLDRLIYPCRSLCQAVHDNCLYRMKAHGFDWPKMLECDRFPEDNDMCIKLINNVVADNNCSACRHPLTYESLVDHYCRADIVMKVTLKSFKDVNGNRELVLRKKKKVYKNNGISKNDARRLTPIIEGGASCVCETINATTERYLVMGSRRGDKMVIIFGIPWKKKNKEFKRGLKAIRKSSTCKGIFNALSQSGIDKRGGLNGKTLSGRKGKGKGKKGRKGKRKGKKGKKGKKRKGKGKKGRKGRKGKGKKKKNRKGGKRNKNRNRNNRNNGNTTSSNSSSGNNNNSNSHNSNSNSSATTPTKDVTSDSQKEKWAREDQALDNFKKAAN